MAERDYIDELELRVALASSEERARHELSGVLKTVKDDLRRDIKLYCGVGILGGNALAAVIATQLTPTPAANAARGGLRAIQLVLGL